MLQTRGMHDVPTKLTTARSQNFNILLRRVPCTSCVCFHLLYSTFFRLTVLSRTDRREGAACRVMMIILIIVVCHIILLLNLLIGGLKVRFGARCQEINLVPCLNVLDEVVILA